MGGVSLEFTGEFNEEGFSVTECLGGSMELSEEQLGLRYQVCVGPSWDTAYPNFTIRSVVVL